MGRPADRSARSTPEDWFDRVPKVELHVHLEGAIPLAALGELVAKHTRRGRAAGLAELEERFRYRDRHHFLETWSWKNGFLREPDDFTFVAEARQVLRRALETDPAWESGSGNRGAE